MRLRTALATRTARTAAAVLATATLLLTGTTAAHAAAPKPKGPAIAHGTVYYYALKNQNTGRVIDDSSAYGLRAFGYNALSYQRFTFVG